MKINVATKRSVFLGVSIPLIIAIVVINVIVTSAWSRLVPSDVDSPSRSLNSFAKALGSGPTPDAISQFARENNVEVVFENSDWKLKTQSDLPDYSTLRALNPMPSDAALGSRGIYRGLEFIAMESAEGKIAVLSPLDSSFAASPLAKASFWNKLLVRVLLTFGVCYFIIAWQLRPLTWLGTGVAEITKGNFDHRIPTAGAREFAKLSEAFNSMSERVSKMVHAKEELVLGVSHELRSPIACLKVASEFIDDPKRKTQIKLYLSQMESIVFDLLETHRLSCDPSSLEVTEVSVSAFLGSFQKKFAPSLGAFRVHQTEDVVILGDVLLLERMLFNLIENAQKYQSSKEEPVDLFVRAQGDWVELEVADRGPGIPSNMRTEIFEPFFRLDKSRARTTGGFGLGLYLCRKVVEAHHGTIDVQDRAGGGSRFLVRLLTISQL